MEVENSEARRRIAKYIFTQYPWLFEAAKDPWMQQWVRHPYPAVDLEDYLAGPSHPVKPARRKK